MRDIQFRVWDTEEKKMFFNAEETYDYGSYTSNGIMASNFKELLESESWIIMQYIGLKDKKGKEIYEGDIVKISNISNILREVKFGWHLGPNGGEYGEQWGYSIGYDQPLSKDYIIEVMGNIYENPELLK